MSNRQARNWRKAIRRRERLLAYRPELDSSLEVRSVLFDFDARIGFAVRKGDARNAVVIQGDRLWRHMDGTVRDAVSGLIQSMQHGAN